LQKLSLPPPVPAGFLLRFSVPKMEATYLSETAVVLWTTTRKTILFSQRRENIKPNISIYIELEHQDYFMLCLCFYSLVSDYLLLFLYYIR
jgi:hypothetical protein